MNHTFIQNIHKKVLEREFTFKLCSWEDGGGGGGNGGRCRVGVPGRPDRTCASFLFFVLLHVVVLHLDPTNCGGFNGSNGFNGVIKFEQSDDAYQVSQGRTMWQLKPLKIIPSYRFFTFSIVSEIQTHLVVSWSSCDSPPAGFSWRDKLRYKRPWPLSCIISFIEICRNCLYYR